VKRIAVPANTPPPTTPPSGSTPPAATGPSAPKRDAPSRPPVANPNAAPVLVNKTPPFSIRMSQLFWILSFAVGGFPAVYFFIIRKDQLPLIADVVRGVTEGRSDEVYDTAADIVFWIVFGTIVAMLLLQIALLVSFMGRRPRIRWWQLATFAVQAILLLLSMEWVALGDRGEPLKILLALQAGLVLLALLCSTFPKGIAWSARQHDVSRANEGVVGGGEF
jgi:hypothetical protein